MSKSHPRHLSNRALWHRAITAGIQPSLSGDKVLRRSGDPAESNRAAPSIVYVQRGQSLTDALIVDKAIASIRNEEQAGWPNSPLEPLAFDTWQLPTSTIALAKRFAGRVTMRKVPTQLTNTGQRTSQCDHRTRLRFLGTQLVSEGQLLTQPDFRATLDHRGLQAPAWAHLQPWRRTRLLW